MHCKVLRSMGDTSHGPSPLPRLPLQASLPPCLSASPVSPCLLVSPELSESAVGTVGCQALPTSALSLPLLPSSHGAWVLSKGGNWGGKGGFHPHHQHSGCVAKVKGGSIIPME